VCVWEHLTHSLAFIHTDRHVRLTKDPFCALFFLVCPQMHTSDEMKCVRAVIGAAKNALLGAKGV